jgi:aminopeptidase N
VTCDDFVQAIADANPDSKLAQLLPQFKRWYSQAGTPRVQAEGRFDAAARTYTLQLSQSCAPTTGQSVKEPFVIPVGLGLLEADGTDLPLQLTGEDSAVAAPRFFVLTQPSESFTFVNIDAEPVPSILRGFTAPVVLAFDYSNAQLLHLLAHDSDAFNRWEAGQRLAIRLAIQSITDTTAAVSSAALDDSYVEAMRAVLRHPTLDAAFKELVLTLPSETYLAEQLDVVDPQRIHAVRESMRLQLAVALAADWAEAYAGMALTNLCLAAQASGEPTWPERTLQTFTNAGNMTDRFNALSALTSSGHALANVALPRFHAMFKDEALVIDKWFSLQAGATDRAGNVLPAVRQLMKHADFSLRNPNRARSVISTFCQGNPGAFHRADAAGYVFWADRVIELDAMNPQVAARLARALDRWKKLAEPYRSAAREAIARVAARSDLSNDVREVVSRAMAD